MSEETVEAEAPARRTREIVATVFGLIAAATPLALWISWSREGLLTVCAIGLSCAAIAAFVAPGSRRASGDYESWVERRKAWGDPAAEDRSTTWRDQV